MYLTAHQLRSLRKAIENNGNCRMTENIKTFLVLLDQIHEIMKLISEGFGFQFLIFLIAALVMKMFTTFSACVILFDTTTLSNVAVFNTYRQYAIYNHVIIFSACFLVGFINQEVSRKSFSIV